VSEHHHACDSEDAEHVSNEAHLNTSRDDNNDAADYNAAAAD